MPLTEKHFNNLDGIISAYDNYDTALMMERVKSDYNDINELVQDLWHYHEVGMINPLLVLDVLKVVADNI